MAENDIFEINDSRRIFSNPKCFDKCFGWIEENEFRNVILFSFLIIRIHTYTEPKKSMVVQHIRFSDNK